MRSIIRFSVDGEANSALRNKLVTVLTKYGFNLNPNATATYEHPSIAQSEQSEAMKEFWETAGSHGGPGALDHFWMYADNPPDSANTL